MESEKVRELEAAKARMIERYLKMQDEADEINGRIYQVCCEIEAMNLQIERTKAEEAKKAAKKAAAAPANGNGHAKPALTPNSPRP